MVESSNRKLMVACAAAAVLLASARHVAAEDAQVARGKYLVALMGCSDCHTPGTFLGKPDMTRYLGGSDVGFSVPGLGIFPGRNLTPDKETGIGNWSSDEIGTAIRTGKRPDGRNLAPIMPFEALANMTDADAQAIAAYLKSIPAVSNKVAGPFGPKEKSTIFVFTVLPANVFNGLPP